MNLAKTLGTGMVALKEFGKGIATKQNGITALKVLGGVAIGVTAARLGTDKKNRVFGGTTEVRNNRKIAIMAAGIGLGTTAIIATKNAIPRVKGILKAAVDVMDVE
jgi:glucokinase